MQGVVAQHPDRNSASSAEPLPGQYQSTCIPTALEPPRGLAAIELRRQSARGVERPSRYRGPGELLPTMLRAEMPRLPWCPLANSKHWAPGGPKKSTYSVNANGRKSLGVGNRMSALNQGGNNSASNAGTVACTTSISAGWQQRFKQTGAENR